MTYPRHPHWSAVGVALVFLGLAGGVAAQSGTGTGTAGTSASASSGKDSGGTGLPRGDRKFVEDAAVGGMAEVQLGQLAQQKGASEQVKQFGARMVQDHGKANDELKQVASGKGVTVPTRLDNHHKRTADKLSKLSGADFDKAYIDDMLKDHKKDVAEFEKQARSAHDPEVRAFAAKTLPVLREHLQMVQSLRDGMAGRKAGS